MLLLTETHLSLVLLLDSLLSTRRLSLLACNRVLETCNHSVARKQLVFKTTLLLQYSNTKLLISTFELGVELCNLAILALQLELLLGKSLLVLLATLELNILDLLGKASSHLFESSLNLSLKFCISHLLYD